MRKETKEHAEGVVTHALQAVAEFAAEWHNKTEEVFTHHRKGLPFRHAREHVRDIETLAGARMLHRFTATLQTAVANTTSPKGEETYHVKETRLVSLSKTTALLLSEIKSTLYNVSYRLAKGGCVKCICIADALAEGWLLQTELTALHMYLEAVQVIHGMLLHAVQTAEHFKG